MLMNDEDIEHFKEHGYVIVQNVFSNDEINDIRTNFHNELATLGIDHNAIMNGTKPPPDDVRGKSVTSNIRFPEWKLNVQFDSRIYMLTKTLMDATFSSGTTPNFEHPLGQSVGDLIPYIDIVCYRLPDHIRAEGGLSLHMDRNPYNPYGASLKKFRPIQSFVSLVDHYGGESGGLQLVSGFHKEYDTYFKNIIIDPTNTEGEFFRMHSKSYVSLQKRVQPLNVPKGSVVYWDNRLPHQTCAKLTSFDSREVVYFSYLPNVPINAKLLKWREVKR
jgi:hypothetical protein